MTESIYKEYQNKYYNPNDNDKRPGDNDNWKSIQEGFHRIGTTQLETSAGLTLGKGTEDEVSITPAELEAMKQGARFSPDIIATGDVVSESETIKYVPQSLRYTPDTELMGYMSMRCNITANPTLYVSESVCDVFLYRVVVSGEPVIHPVNSLLMFLPTGETSLNEREVVSIGTLDATVPVGSVTIQLDPLLVGNDGYIYASQDLG